MNKKLYPKMINKEISLLQFNKRVLSMAMDKNIPLLERVKFLCIASTNLDEFFEVKVASLKQRVIAHVDGETPDDNSAASILIMINEIAHKLVSYKYRILNNAILPSLAKENVHFLPRNKWSDKLNKWVQTYFDKEIMPLLSPLGLDPAHPFPQILNKSLNFIVRVKGKGAFGRKLETAIVQAPRALPRIIQIPQDLTNTKEQNFLFLSSIIHANIDKLFPQLQVKGCYQFRVTRNSNLFVDEEEIDDLLNALQGELPSRRYGDAVRLEVSKDCPKSLRNFLKTVFELNESDIYSVNGPVNLTRLIAVTELINHDNLKYKPFSPTRPKALFHGTNLFETISQQDILLHHPFESFAPVLELVKQAAFDPNVVVIKQTLYRTGLKSVLVDYLIEAAKRGKEVTVVVELRARFDEEANISLANKLQEAGAHVVYGVVGFKAHAKMLMIVRREQQQFRRYVHLGTGNYHTQTSKLYTDYGFLTCDKEIGDDINNIFSQLISLGRSNNLTSLIQSPFNLKKKILDMIKTESAEAQHKQKSFIKIKINGLTDYEVINALYDASQCGVKIELIVRGMCSLRPGIAGLSENITVRSIVGRFLEHTRVYYFHNKGNELVFLSSADWMPRNLDRRVELCFPIKNESLKKRIIKESFEYYLADNQQSWQLKSNGEYNKIKKGKNKAISAQENLLMDNIDNYKY